MKVILLITSLLFAISGIFSMQRQFQMFQQNSYFPSRYIRWLKTSFEFKTVISIIFLVLSLVFLFVQWDIPLLIIAILQLLIRGYKCRLNHKTSIKKLVYTPRVKRMVFTASLVLCVLSSLTLFWGLGVIFATIVILAAHFPQCFVLLSNLINSPLEKSINKGFVDDAKRILALHNNLLTIGVTGSYGKTSVKFILKRILNEKFNVTATPESFNTPMGIVRTVREHMKPQTEVFIAEMGAKNIGDIKELCDLCHPQLGIITAVGPQHLETFGSVENVANAKFELADCCLNNPKGKVYVNFDSIPAAERAQKIKDREKYISFGTDTTCDCYATDVKYTPEGTSFSLVYGEWKIPLSCKLLGKHSVTNILGAAAIALDLGVDPKQLRFAIASLKPAPHRLELKPFINGSVLIDDAYNSNPEGCIAAVNVLGSFEGMRRIIVTPGLVELGDKEYEYNYNLGAAAAKQCDDIILVGVKRAIPMQDAINKSDFDSSRLIVAESFKQAMEHLRNMTDKNTVVLFENDLPDNYAG